MGLGAGVSVGLVGLLVAIAPVAALPGVVLWEAAAVLSAVTSAGEEECVDSASGGLLPP